MLDNKLLRADVAEAQALLARRGYRLDTARWETLEKQRQALQSESEELAALRNRMAKQIGVAKARGEAVDAIMQEVAAISEQAKQKSVELKHNQEQIRQLMLDMPNFPDTSTPSGLSEADNVETHRWGDLPVFGFQPLDHVTLAEKSGTMNFDQGALLSGSRFVVLHGDLARLHRALGSWMMDVHTQQHGYQEVHIPQLVNRTSLQGSGQLPKFANDLFFIEESELGLIPTAEVALANLHRDSILDGATLPLRYTALSQCFRSEAGSYGKDTRGMIRMHQFEKVELFEICQADTSMQRLEAIRESAEKILQLLELPYRVVTLCGGDMGFSAAKTYDLEVWMPSQMQYREISSVSNTTDFQARRLQIRCRFHAKDKPELCHMLNGSGVAVGRALVAILENYQQADGSIRIPQVLQPYMGQQSVLQWT